MSETKTFDLPSASEKLPQKFMIDAFLKGKAQQEDEIEDTPAEPKAPEKNYYRIGEVAELLGIETYVVRYWESEFRSIRPIKSSSGHRVYSRKDLETFQSIRHLLYEEKYSIKGAKKRLLESKKEAAVANQTTHRAEEIKKLCRGLKELLTLSRMSPGVF